jgi:predicted esterase
MTKPSLNLAPRIAVLVTAAALMASGCNSRSGAVAPAASPLDSQRRLAPSAPAHSPQAPADGRRDLSAETAASAPQATPTALLPGWQPLPVEGAKDAVLFLPETPSGLVLVITHGAGGTPEAHCEQWERRTRGQVVLLCPRGREMHVGAVPAAYYYPDHNALEAEVVAAVSALEVAAPATSQATWVYAGYSQGANMGVLMILEHLDRFAALCFTEGGFAGWSQQRAKQAAKRRDLKVAFVCGTSHCRELAHQSARLLRAQGVATRVESATGAGHRPDGPVGDKLDALLPWLLPRLCVPCSTSKPGDPHNP